MTMSVLPARYKPCLHPIGCPRRIRIPEQAQPLICPQCGDEGELLTQPLDNPQASGVPGLIIEDRGDEGWIGWVDELAMFVYGDDKDGVIARAGQARKFMAKAVFRAEDDGASGC